MRTNPGPAEQHVVRAAENQAIFRSVNEQLVSLNEAFDQFTETAEFVCECARIDCVERIEMTLAEYADVRSNPATFVVAPSTAHYVPEVEVLVAAREHYFVLQKIGPAAEIAKRLAPR